MALNDATRITYYKLLRTGMLQFVAKYSQLQLN